MAMPIRPPPTKDDTMIVMNMLLLRTHTGDSVVVVVDPVGRRNTSYDDAKESETLSMVRHSSSVAFVKLRHPKEHAGSKHRDELKTGGVAEDEDEDEDESEAPGWSQTST